jgi:hypothetical protein
VDRLLAREWCSHSLAAQVRFLWTRTRLTLTSRRHPPALDGRQRWWWRVAEWLTDPPSVTLEGRRRRTTRTRRDERYARLVSDHEIETSLALVSNNDRTRPDERDERRARLDCAGLDDLRWRTWVETSTALVSTNDVHLRRDEPGARHGRRRRPGMRRDASDLASSSPPGFTPRGFRPPAGFGEDPRFARVGFHPHPARVRC